MEHHRGDSEEDRPDKRQKMNYEDMERQLEESESRLEESKKKIKELARKAIFVTIHEANTFEEMVEMLQDAEFPECDINAIPFVDIIDASSVSRPSERQTGIVAMRKFDYANLRNPDKCPWNLFSLPDDASIDELCCAQFFNGNRASYDSLVESYAGSLDLLRRALIYHHKKLPVKENEHFREPYSVWLKDLLLNLQGFTMTIENRRHRLQFEAQLGPPPDNRTGNVAEASKGMIVRGYCDMDVKVGENRLLLGEFKRPFGDFSVDSPASTRRQAISQTYGELQGWIAVEKTKAGTGGVMSETAASVEEASPRCWYSALGMDGMTLRVFVACPQVEEGNELPTVHMSEDGNLSCPRYVRVLLLALAWMVRDDVPIASLPTKGSVMRGIMASDNQEPPDSARRDGGEAESDDTSPDTDPGQRSGSAMPPIHMWDANDWFRATCMMRRELDEEEFWEFEEAEVARLNAILNPSVIHSVTLAKLGERKMSV